MKVDRPLRKNFRRALIVGTVRDASKNIAPDILRMIDELSELIPTIAFIVESDSSDDTVFELEKLSLRDSRIRFISLGSVANVYPDRIARLRYCRNQYVNEIRNNPDYKECDIIVVADLDGINTRIEKQHFMRALDFEEDWDALGANQTGHYYDLLALRHPLWSPNSFQAELKWLAPILGTRAAWRHSVSDRMIKIPKGSAPILVDSAFGGLCIYRRWIFEVCDYGLEDTEIIDEIDHVTLHRKARKLGARIYIHPGLINAHWTLHALQALKGVTLARSIFGMYPLSILFPFFRKALLKVSKL